MKGLISIIILACIVACNTQKNAQEISADSTAALLEKQQYVFKARNVLPSRGSIVQLTSDYDLRVTKDSVIAFLPYYGRAYTAPIGNASQGIQFTSVKFDYSIRERKKGGWQISIRPKDIQDVQQLFLTVGSGNVATLQVTSNNRQTISYTGTLQ